jgi:uncharacterized protein (DUF302 family)
MTDCLNVMEISGTETVWQIIHRQFRSCAEFEQLTHHLEGCLGKFDPTVASTMSRSPTEARALIEKMQGEQDLMIFMVLDHGRAQSMVGAQGKAKQYLIGNPLTAIEMTRYQMGAGLYAPLRLLVYENASGECIVEYDQPSSLFGQFGDPRVLNVGQELDRKLAAVLRRAVELASQ